MATRSNSNMGRTPDGRPITMDMLFGNDNGGLATAAPQRIKVGYGKANYPSILASYTALKVTPDFVRVSAATSGKRVGQNQYHHSGVLELNGGIVQSDVEHPNGTVILLQATWKRGGSPVRDGALFMRLRVGAPMWSIRAKVPTAAENTIGEYVEVFQGYADMMNAEELGLLKLKVNRSFTEKFMSEEEVEECFAAHQLHRETVARPSLTAIHTPTGVEMREVPATPKRRLNVRGQR